MAANYLTTIEPTELYNILNQSTVYSNLSNPTYLLLLDARSKNEYNESHVVTSKRVLRNEDDIFQLPYESELECKENVVVYDGNTSTLDDITKDAVQCSRIMSAAGSKNRVKVLKGGYEQFSALYPFLRTQKVLFMTAEMDELRPYPLEIIPAFLYIGNKEQAAASYIQKDLKIKAHINCTINDDPFFTAGGPEVLHIPIEDNAEADILSHFQPACTFLNEHHIQNHAVLVYCNRGISASVTIALAYLMENRKVTLQAAWDHIKHCSRYMRPNRGFVEQLSQFEETLFGSKITDISDPNF